MSHAHQNEFERIKNEHNAVVSLLSAQAKNSQKPRKGRKDSYDPDILEAAVATANDAYALLLMARAEGFLRTYLDSLNVSLNAEPKLSTLIDKCRAEFNKTKPKIPISANIAQEVHDLRKQRNAYAHGYGSRLFPSVARMVIILGKFFDPLP